VRGESLSFDNMQDRPFKGSADWIEGSVVLDVPETSTALAYGILLSGSGKVWIADVRLELVGEEVPTTGGGQEDSLPEGPVNLDFSRLEEEEPES
jgi:hypothetical protein